MYSWRGLTKFVRCWMNLQHFRRDLLCNERETDRRAEDKKGRQPLNPVSEK